MEESKTEIRGKESRFERSIETQILLKRLGKMEDGQVVTYEELGSLIGKKIDGAFTKLSQARKIAFREHKRVFDCVPGVGVKRLNADETADTAMAFVQRQKRQARRKLRDTADMPFGEVSEQSRHGLTVARTLLAFTSEAASKKNIAKIDGAVQQTRAELPFGNALKLFG